MQDRARAGQNDTHRRRGGGRGGGEGASIEDRWSNVQSAVGTSISSGGKDHHRPTLTPSYYGRCSEWGASADGCSTPPPSSPKSAIAAVKRHAVDQPERAKSNQCDQSPTSIAFSGATVTDDDAVAHIIFYGSLSWLSNTCRWAVVGLGAISTLRSHKTDPACLCHRPGVTLHNPVKFCHKSAQLQVTPQALRSHRGHSVLRMRGRVRGGGYCEGARGEKRRLIFA